VLLLLTYINRDGEVQRSSVLMARALDLSRSGAKLETREPLPVGSRLQLSLAVREEEVSANASVMHITAGVRGRFKIGIQFDELLAEALIARVPD
jgi:hypothetical protein